MDTNALDFTLQHLHTVLAESKVLRAQQQAALAVLDAPYFLDTCDCGDCQAVQATKPYFICSRCGYRGRPATMMCCCGAPMCRGVGADDRRFGCPHGTVVCPVCTGKSDGWVIVGALRAILGSAPVERLARDDDNEEESQHE